MSGLSKTSMVKNLLLKLCPKLIETRKSGPKKIKCRLYLEQKE